MTRLEHTIGLGGDFVTAHTRDDNNLKAIRLFLEAVQRLVPESIADLASIAADVPTKSDLLREWATRWGFTSDKLIRIATRTANELRQRPGSKNWVLTGSIWSPDFPRLANPSWDPIEETEQAFRARVETYILQIKATPGIRPAPKKRALEHFDWLALHQVAGWTEANIAEQYEEEGVKESAVSRALKETAKLVGLRLRPAAGRSPAA